VTKPAKTWRRSRGVQLYSTFVRGTPSKQGFQAHESSQNGQKATFVSSVSAMSGGVVKFWVRLETAVGEPVRLNLSWWNWSFFGKIMRHSLAGNLILQSDTVSHFLSKNEIMSEIDESDFSQFFRVCDHSGARQRTWEIMSFPIMSRLL
jgi:hypothetical protein